MVRVLVRNDGSGVLVYDFFAPLSVKRDGSADLEHGRGLPLLRSAFTSKRDRFHTLLNGTSPGGVPVAEVNMIDQGRSRSVGGIWATAGVLLVLWGCGSGGGDAEPDLAAFIGTWEPVSGTMTVDCAGQRETKPVTSNTVWEAGTGMTSDLMQPPDSSGCVLLANVAGRTATAIPNQHCRQVNGGVLVEVTVTSYTFVLGADTTTASETAAGTARVTAAGEAVDCTSGQAASYRRR
jgi:hypothetical protein